MCNSILHSGKNTECVDGRVFQYNATKIMFSLAKDLLNERYCIYINNQYTSLELCANLRSVNTDVTVTLHKDRKSLLKKVAGERRKPNEHKLQYEKNAGVIYLGWKDKRDVYMMSTCTACWLYQ